MKLIVGLGNPGKRYAHTRHNLGFLIVDRLAAQNEIPLATKLCDSMVGTWFCGGEQIIFVKPQTFMNRSGAAVECLLREFRGSAQDLVVIYDDLDLPFGRIRIRPKGSAGGHRGMVSILEQMAGAPFYRIRVGIGRPAEGVDPVDYVLEPFNAQETAELDEVVGRAAQSVISLLRDGPQQAMASYNRAP
jgi:peptidyl-tRNA hydrolase, PTH1 family